MNKRILEMSGCFGENCVYICLLLTMGGTATTNLVMTEEIAVKISSPTPLF